ncbi:MAG: NF038129 family PEP-CTERM protein [Telluria sp.]
MFNFKIFARQAMLALVLAFAGNAAIAGPTYLVTLHTQAYSGESGLLDFGFLGDSAATAEMVTLSNFSGMFGLEYDRAGGIAGELATTVNFSNTRSANYLTQEVTLGGDFTFNLHFSDDYTMPLDPLDAQGLSFVVSLFDNGLTAQLAQLVQFDLMPFVANDPAQITITVNDDLAVVTEVAVADIPEPSQLLLMLSALALAGVALRRRRTL